MRHRFRGNRLCGGSSGVQGIGVSLVFSKWRQRSTCLQRCSDRVFQGLKTAVRMPDRFREPAILPPSCRVDVHRMSPLTKGCFRNERERSRGRERRTAAVLPRGWAIAETIGKDETALGVTLWGLDRGQGLGTAGALTSRGGCSPHVVVQARDDMSIVLAPARLSPARAGARAQL